MNTPGGGVANTASGAVNVVQAKTIHGDVTYQIPPDSSPEERFQIGLRYLHGGILTKARECLGEAVAQGHVTSRSCFYLLLALLSGRTLQQMTDEDIETLRSLRGRVATHPRDAWADAIKSIMRLIDSVESPDQDPRILMKELDELGTRQQDEIFHHLEVFLRGPVRNWTWRRVFDRAGQEQCEGQRTDRVWRFFQPEPIPPRVRSPRPARIDLATWVRCGLATAALGATAGFLVRVAWQHAWLSTAPALLVAVAAAIVGAYTGVEWRYRVVRIRAKDRELLPTRQRTRPAAGDGFAAEIDRMFTHYFGTYLPRGADRGEWLTQTSGARQFLRDEVVDLYRESRVEAKRVAWLIRYLISDVQHRWRSGRLWDYHDRLRPPVAVRALFVLAVTTFTIGAVRVAGEAVVARPLSGSALAVCGLAAGWLAARDWTGMLVERRRFAAEAAETGRLRDDRVAAYGRWCRKLAIRPDDLEMAHWLDCDRKVLMRQATEHYKLALQAIIAHAFMEAPAPGCKWARVRNGPWRYSRYQLLVFLLTADGVRQMAVDLDFEQARFRNQERLNYRYDAVAAVGVQEADDGHKTFELALVNSHSIDVEVTGPASDPVAPGEDCRTVSRATLDAAGLGNTLHVLEGIAAEGKAWIHHERRREEDCLGRLVSAERATVAPGSASGRACPG
ncbi:MAG: hypothetical protein HKP61_22270 [Dactylosporangium sp.]|nr:hypothetical protein [Dactylosporangium sp.]NNJ63604.1 hypothetical protein [Dactylosporangium sp.]